MPRLWIQEKEIVRRQKHVSSELIRNFSGLNCYMYARYVATMLVERVSQKYARLKCHKLATEHAERLCGFQIRTYKFKITSFCFKKVRVLDHYLIQFFLTIGQNNFWKTNKIIAYLNWKDFHNQISNLDNPSCSNVNASLPGLGIQDKFCLIFLWQSIFSIEIY